MRPRSVFRLLLVGVALISFPVAVFSVISRGISWGALILLALVVPTSWLRLRLEPGTHLTLAPMLVFSTLVLSYPSVAVLVAILAGFVGSKVFARGPWRVALEEAGEDAIASLSAAGAFTRANVMMGFAQGTLFPFTFSVAAFIVAKLLVASVRSRLLEGVSPYAFLRGPAKQIAGHLVVLALGSLGLSYLANVYSEARYLVVALGTIALIELYHPWKLLADQNEVLYANLAMIAQAIDVKDPYTARHSRNVAHIAIKIARAMRLPESEVRRIRIGALLHDIGKIGVSGRIIRKPEALAPQEKSVMQMHPVISADIMQPIDLLAESAEIVRHHHEHHDGSGYPDGLAGEEIPTGSRVVLVADAFDAMTTDRPYRRGRSKEEALRVLKEHAGKQFDPRAVDALESIIDLI